MEEPSGDLGIPGELDGHPVTGIGDYAFFECALLTEVTIPASVVRMGLNPFARSGLKNIRVNSANPVYKATNGHWGRYGC